MPSPSYCWYALSHFWIDVNHSSFKVHQNNIFIKYEKLQIEEFPVSCYCAITKVAVRDPASYYASYKRVIQDRYIYMYSLIFLFVFHMCSPWVVFIVPRVNFIWFVFLKCLGKCLTDIDLDVVRTAQLYQQHHLHTRVCTHKKIFHLPKKSAVLYELSR